MKRLSPYVMKEDLRGRFLGITQEGWAEVNFIETKAGEVRGNHYHEQTRELFFIVSGEIDITIKNLKSGEESRFRAKKGDIFIIEPYELHTFSTRTDAEWVNMLSKPLDPSQPDFRRAEA